jgi:hypothetical protein
MVGKLGLTPKCACAAGAKRRREAPAPSLSTLEVANGMKHGVSLMAPRPFHDARPKSNLAATELEGDLAPRNPDAGRPIKRQ